FFLPGATFLPTALLPSRSNTQLCDNPVTQQTNSVRLTAASRSDMVRNGGRQVGFTPIRVAEERPNETQMLSRRRAVDHRETYWYYGDHGPGRGVIAARPMTVAPNMVAAVATNTAMSPALATPVRRAQLLLPPPSPVLGRRSSAPSNR